MTFFDKQRENEIKQFQGFFIFLPNFFLELPKNPRKMEEKREMRSVEKRPTSKWCVVHSTVSGSMRRISGESVMMMASRTKNITPVAEAWFVVAACDWHF